MHFNFPHKTTTKAAKEKIVEVMTEHRDEIAKHAKITKDTWDGDTLRFAVEIQGKTITGTLEVTETDYILDAQLPLLWRMFEGRIEKEVEKQLKAMQ